MKTPPSNQLPQGSPRKRVLGYGSHGRNKMWKYSGIFLIITGIIHNAVAIFLMHDIYRQIIQSGFVNAVAGDFGRWFASWFFICGIFIIFLGQIVHHYIQRGQRPAPAFFGWTLLALSVFICIAEPISGSWLFIPQALIIIFSNRKKKFIP
jgi:hypothetical protein